MSLEVHFVYFCNRFLLQHCVFVAFLNYSCLYCCPYEMKVVCILLCQTLKFLTNMYSYAINLHTLIQHKKITTRGWVENVQDIVCDQHMIMTAITAVYTS